MYIQTYRHTDIHTYIDACMHTYIFTYGFRGVKMTSTDFVQTGNIASYGERLTCIHIRAYLRLLKMYSKGKRCKLR